MAATAKASRAVTLVLQAVTAGRRAGSVAMLKRIAATVQSSELGAFFADFMR